MEPSEPPPLCDICERGRYVRLNARLRLVPRVTMAVLYLQALIRLRRAVPSYAQRQLRLISPTQFGDLPTIANTASEYGATALWPGCWYPRFLDAKQE
jgi:hypothetical protein